MSCFNIFKKNFLRILSRGSIIHLIEKRTGDSITTQIENIFVKSPRDTWAPPTGDSIMALDLNNEPKWIVETIQKDSGGKTKIVQYNSHSYSLDMEWYE